MNDLIPYSQQETQLIKDTICKGASDTELKLFMAVCQRTNLDPFTKQIYAIKRWDSSLNREVLSTQLSIDGLRLIADRSGLYRGQVGPYWCGEDGQWVDVWLKDTPPVAAKVGVWKEGFKEPIFGTAKFKEYAQRKKDGSFTKFWAEKPDVMIAKCAEGLALKKCFPLDVMKASKKLEEPSKFKQEKVEKAKDYAAMIAERAQQLQDEEQVIVVEEELDQDEGPHHSAPIESKQVVNHATGEAKEVVVFPKLDADKLNVDLYVVPFGKFKGKTLKQVGVHEAKSYRDWLRANAKKTNKALSQESDFYCSYVDRFEKYSLEKPEEVPFPTAQEIAEHIPF